MKTEKELLKIGYEAELFRLTNELQTTFCNINTQFKYRIESNRFIEMDKDIGQKMTMFNLLFDGYSKLNKESEK